VAPRDDDDTTEEDFEEWLDEDDADEPEEEGVEESLEDDCYEDDLDEEDENDHGCGGGRRVDFLEEKEDEPEEDDRDPSYYEGLMGGPDEDEDDYEEPFDEEGEYEEEEVLFSLYDYEPEPARGRTPSPAVPTQPGSRRAVPYLRLPPTILAFFTRFVIEPFKSHPPTQGWEVEVRCKGDGHHREDILGKGRTDFDVPYGHLPPQDKVLLYCFYYMQMHVASTYHVLRQAAGHGLDLGKDAVVIDFGCGPLTLGVALAWFLKGEGGQEERSPCPALRFIGIERSREMVTRAEAFAAGSGLFAPASSFRFVGTFEEYGTLSEMIDSLAADRSVGPSTLVLNFSYIFSSDSLDVGRLIDMVQSLLRQYWHSAIWVVYQNPRGLPAMKWETFRTGIGGLEQIAAGDADPAYLNITNRPGDVLGIKLTYALLRRPPGR
jgi:hypothetical protein